MPTQERPQMPKSSPDKPVSAEVREAKSVTELLNLLRQGSEQVMEELLPRIQADLRRIARSHLRRAPVRDLLQTTVLVDDFLLKSLEMGKAQWQDRREFFALAGTLMRRATIDSMRERGAEKRGGKLRLEPLDGQQAGRQPEIRADFLALHQALGRLGQADPEGCRIIELRYFLGMTAVEVADALGLSRATVMRRWASARLWLLRELSCESAATESKTDERAVRDVLADISDSTDEP